MASTSSRRHLTVMGAVTAVLGVALLAWQLRDVNLLQIREQIYGVGWGFALILALGGLRFALRALAWSLSVEAPARLKFGHAFAAVLSGDAIGNLTPLGPIVSEPAKAAFVRGRLDLHAAIAALAIENLFYTLSVAAMIAAGTIALLFSFELPGDIRYASEISLGIVVAMCVAAAWVLSQRPALISRLLGAVASRGGSAAPSTRIERVQRLEHEIYSFSSRRKEVLAPLIVMEIAFHALGVVEIYVTLLLLGIEPSLMLAFVLEGANRLITVVFRFVPMRLGVDESGTEALTRVLGFGAGLGAALAIVRKARMIVWSLVGGALLVRHGLTARRILQDPQLARAPDS